MRIFILITLTLLVCACNSIYLAPESPFEEYHSNEPIIDSLLTKLNSIDDGSLKANQSGEKFGKKVLLYSELVELFNPDVFDCGLGDGMKKKLKESKRKKKSKEGYVPDIVVNNTDINENVIKLDDRGANVLLHYFTYEMANKKESKAITTDDAQTQKNFKLTTWIDNKPDGYSSFFLTMDCSGFFSASAKVAAKGGFLGIGKVDVAAEGESTIDQKKSVVVMKTLLNSPLYDSYQGRGVFRINSAMTKEDRVEILKSRLDVLENILAAIPVANQVDGRQIFLATNYEAIITSNKGNAGYNGTGQLKSNLNISFQSTETSAGVQAENSVSRKSEYVNYNTYILTIDKDAEAETVTFKSLKKKIEDLKTEIRGGNPGDREMSQPNT